MSEVHVGEVPLGGQRIIPVVVLDDAANAVRLAEALQRGGITCAEITLRTPAGLESIRAIARAIPEFRVGAGTVTMVDQLDQVIEAGASFVVAPGLDDAVLHRAANDGVTLFPGVATATEVMRARAAGFTHLKIFPVEPLGGHATIESLAGPFPEVRFLPSGGITLGSAASYLALPSVFAVSGSWMATRRMLADGDFAAIETHARATIELLRTP
jgi:2-dehydro-3-deoxyphosphogluconate aldolase/(4S)-4-hydroxy-2-oxoglutarate aldolase